MRKPCLDCGALSEDSRCPEHLRPHEAKRRSQYAKTNRHKDAEYDAAWRRLSRRARALQPWCSVCGTSEDLTCDHLPSAWVRKAEGKSIRLVDVDVLCRVHNAEKGSSKPDSARALEVTHA